jgi:hypothetical protein
MPSSLLKKFTIILNLVILIPCTLVIFADIFLWILSFFLRYYEHTSAFGPFAPIIISILLFFVSVTSITIRHILKESNKVLVVNILNGLMLLPGIASWGALIEGDFSGVVETFALLLLPLSVINLIYVNKFRVG